MPLILSRCICPVLFVAVAGIAQGAAIEVQVSTPQGKAIADAVVYAMPTNVQPSKPTRAIAIEQIDREFVPHVSVVQLGTTASFPNRDSVRHHVYSFSPAKTFEIKLYSGEAPREVVFDKPGAITLGCNIHDWMVGYVYVVDTPYFGKSGKDGKVRLEGLPAGDYEVKLWHPGQRTGVAPQKFTLDTSAERKLGFQLEITPRRPKYKPPLDPSSYQ